MWGGAVGGRGSKVRLFGEGSCHGVMGLGELAAVVALSVRGGTWGVWTVESMGPWRSGNVYSTVPFHVGSYNRAPHFGQCCCRGMP